MLWHAILAAPAGRALLPVGGSDCGFPANTLEHAVITSGDATLCAHSMYRAVAIGGTLYDGTSQETGTIEGTYPSSIRAMAQISSSSRVYSMDGVRLRPVC